MAYTVKAPAVQVIVGARAHFLETGAVLPEGVDDSTTERLLAEGLIEAVEAVTPVESVEAVTPVEVKTEEPAGAEVTTAVAEKPATPKQQGK